MQMLKGLWGWLAALVAIVVVGGYIATQKFAGDSPVVAPAQVAQAPSAAAPATPESPLAPTPKLDLDAPAAQETVEPPIESPVDPIAGQAIDIPARPVARLRGQGTWTDGLKTLGEAVAKTKAAAEKAGLKADGRPLVAFTETDDNGFHFEAMLPLAKAPEGKPKLDSGVEIGASPAGKALKFQHRGPYAEIDSTYEAITAFLDEKGLDTKNLFVEEYLTDLQTSDDDGLEVDIYVFLK
ncbi:MULTISPECIES: GyrI-like domain-containing protein [Methylosinus]|uniref:AraC family transcriptional regulator n=1 Tax=Methylosinus trichosporium (strain ATCC 35070 / NCIMB 11131 / UNIQEM 75 / OB3b) TaxID=595536 RepID=A0A2D2CUG5_METT3|nr:MULTISPECIES: GyrI-like domain-containing protein [Methylosinus]ATQ66492.1 AraC family transcriptional regulator [Methylosinus trichosporium OB3b]OBS52667.1 transcription activator effector-binding protein [Methylosinus sp. 3S-1]